MWLWVIVLVVIIGAIAVVAARRSDTMVDVYEDRPDATLPTGRALTADDLAAVRFSTAVRGYRMDEVDAFVARLQDDLQARRSGAAPGELDGLDSPTDGGLDRLDSREEGGLDRLDSGGQLDYRGEGGLDGLDHQGEGGLDGLDHQGEGGLDELDHQSEVDSRDEQEPPPPSGASAATPP
jgi:DivIVA domain-containing protein